MLEAGSVVQLKSGGQVMTVGVIAANGLFCYWFDVNGVFQTHKIPAEALMLYQPHPQE
ncbi:YodC family protein [Aeromonas veronii]|uniref:YodC family protein n=1 Tax=Aeromonas veronii TaxID=654 RepID=UPI002B483344|nr:DUF2158 domain-containing protein [Aeromonas veronii]